jgi:hypothetical protein
MTAAWVNEELKDVNLNDSRLNDRMGHVLDQLGGHPHASIPAACGGWAETQAAYRFFDNQKVSFEGLLEPHIEATYRRIKDHSVVILSQDTTEIDLTRPTQQVDGAGYLSVNSRKGAFLHPFLAFTPEGTPLGTVYAEAWTREEQKAPDSRTRQEKELARRRTPIEEKESARWLDAFAEARVVAQHAPETQLICLADSEADIYELLEASQASGVDWIVRGSSDRALKTTENSVATANQMRAQVLSNDSLFTNELHIRARQAKIPSDKRKRNKSRPARDATVEARAASVTLRAPRRHDRKLKDIAVNVVLVTEVDPPPDEEAVEWILLTSLPIDSANQVREVIQYYTVRWMIEVYFRTLKSSCRIEERHFETIDRALNAVAVYMIVAWRALLVCRISREFPDINCEAIFEPEEWKSVYYVVHKKPPPTDPPTLKEMTRMLGTLGGYVDRVRDDEPGPQTVCMGLQRAHDITCCWKLFGPQTRRKKICV